jgi:hypothetical protein
MWTGVLGGPDGAQAVASWMSTSSSEILLEPGTGPSGSGRYQFVVELGWAHRAADGQNDVAVVAVCADSANFIAVCP